MPDRKAVSLVLAGLAAVGAALLALHASHAASTARISSESSRCSPGKKFGQAVRVNYALRVNGRSQYSVSLHRGDRISTSSNGEASVCLKMKTSTCDVRPSTLVIVNPKNPKKRIVFRVVAGEMQCDTTSGMEAEFDTRHARVKAGDPTLAIIARKQETIVKVLHGLVSVTGTAGSGAPVTVAANQQSTVPAKGDPAAPTGLHLTPKEKGIFDKILASEPPPFLGRPAIGGSDALRAIFHRGSLVVGYDKSLVPDEAATQFARSFLAFLAHGWRVKLAFKVTIPSSAADGLASGALDAFVTRDPGAVVFAGRRAFGTKAGATAIPFLSDSNGQLVSIAFRVDAGLTTAARRFIGTTALQTDDYRQRYKASFNRDPQFDVTREIVFPTAAHAKGTSTVAHKHFIAVIGGKIAPRLRVAEHLKGACDAPSAASLRADAWHCVDGNGRERDPCFSGIHSRVVCPENLSVRNPTAVAAISLTAPLPTKTNPGGDVTQGRARLLRTAGLCTPLFSSDVVYDGRQAAYVCAKTSDAAQYYLFDEPYHGSKPWSIVAVPRAVEFGKSVLADAVNVPEIWWW